MKANALPSQVNLFANKILDALAGPEQPYTKKHPGKELPKSRSNRPVRKDFFYYKQITNHDTQEIVGHLADIGTGGFKLDSQNPILPNQDFRFRLDLTSEIADKPFMTFVARSRWCKVDPIDPYVYNVGYQLVRIAPEDLEIFNRMMEKYGREHRNGNMDLRRSNKW
jgi:PilZ domain